MATTWEVDLEDQGEAQVTRFYGGMDRGMLVQLTLPPDSDVHGVPAHVLQIPPRVALELAAALKAAAEA